MSNRFVFLSDFSAEEIPYGGGEINDRELVNILRDRGHEVLEARTRDFDLNSLKKESGSFFIISNFVLLKPPVISAMKKEKYVICEHDHKYVASRNPAEYKDYKVPYDKILNRDFYKKAIAVFCQTSFHAKILKSNLTLDNISSLGGNLWSKDILETMRKLSKVEKDGTAAVMESSLPHKNKQGAINFCIDRGIDYRLIPKKEYKSFLEDLAKSSKFVFLPQTPETCSRVLVEARMLGLSVSTNSRSGAVHEDWFSLKGEELIDKMIQKREEIASLVETSFAGQKNRIHNDIEEKDFKISLITSLYNGDKHLEGFLKDITSQTIFNKCELIIVNANSPGNEEETILKYQEKYPNIVYKKLEKDPGIYECWNIAIEMGTGDFISNANLDDRRSYQQLELLTKELLKNKDVDLVYSECMVTHRENESYTENSSSGNVYAVNEFSKENMIKCLPGPMPLWRRSMHEKAGLFDSSYRFAGDWEMWLRAVKNGSKFKKARGPLGLYHHNPEGLTTDPKKHAEKFAEEKRVFFENKEVFGDKVFAEYLRYFSQ